MEVTWNRTIFKQLGRVRVLFWETIFVIIVPADLSSYIFARRWSITDMFREFILMQRCSPRYPPDHFFGELAGNYATQRLDIFWECKVTT
jgi:hypothetical protein